MLTSLIYPLPWLLSVIGQLDNLIIWFMLLVSAAWNVYLLKQNKQLKSQLANRENRQAQDTCARNTQRVKHVHDKFVTHHRPEKPALARLRADTQQGPVTKLRESELLSLELELSEIIQLDDSKANDKHKAPSPRYQENSKHRLQGVLQSMTGWHRSLVPFLLQNIGWFIGILCFISGSVFFIAYTEGFNKSVTIFFTILSYSLLLAWGGYRLRDKVAHAAISGNILMATSLLLVPLNFSAAAQLIGNSIGIGQYSIAILATMIGLGTLFYITRLISGVFNRQLLRGFSGIYCSLSMLQLMVPLLQNSQSMILQLLMQTIAIGLLLVALIGYLPTVMQQALEDKKYLMLFSGGSLIYAAVVSFTHLTIASPVTIILSHYAPVVMAISAALFYMDGQLSRYKQQMPVLSWFSLLAYAVSFTAIILSLPAEWSRIITLLLAVVMYARLMWLYRSLVPFYLVLMLTSFLYYDVILAGLLTSTAARQWLYLLSVPVLGLFYLTLIYLRKSEIQRGKLLQLTRHLFHVVMFASVLLSVFSQWHTSSGIIAMSNSLVIIVSGYYLLKSQQLEVVAWLGEKITSAYYYLLLFLPVALILLASPALLDIDSKLALITFLALCYSLNSYFFRFRIFNTSFVQLEKEVLINSSLLITLLLLGLVAIGFTLSIKTGMLIFVLALNSLFLSLSLYNRGLFYGFIVIASASAVVFKLCLSHGTSTGLLTLSLVIILFYCIHWLDRKRMTEMEAINAATIGEYNPGKILWCYPCNDYLPVSEPKARGENNHV